ncbi:hypothetical protein ACFQZX_02500 [Mucilaginibacter litoreus]|uniref:Lipoprotein n=1 Tax=Mucilaginibacter litoreus TaxID=1048221 RepID=A0ABW3AMY3_9SPHI
MKKILYLPFIAFILSSCSYTVYNMNRGLLQKPKKDSYQVEYVTEVPVGTTAKITYMGPNNKFIEEKYTGTLNKLYTMPGDKELTFTVDVKLPQTTPQSKLHTYVKVDGETITDQTQTGKKVHFSFKFKLP